jgi:hypothetical protein
MMRAAYLYQTINLLVAVLMVPLLLRFLDVSAFVLWTIFITFGGVTLQLENAIQIVTVREIAREYHSGNRDSLRAAVRKARKAYTVLSLFVLVPVLVVGLLYLNYIAAAKLGLHGSYEWLVFIGAYALNYSFGTNNSILLGMVEIARFNNINSLTRTINFVTTYLFLRMGLSVLGASLSFALAVVISCTLNARSARSALQHYSASPQAALRPDAKFEHAKSANIVKYTFYMLSSFIVYKASLLVATMIFAESVIGAYSLTLQANTMLTMLAVVVPLQVWLHRLVSAITAGDRDRIVREFVRGALVANGLFIAGAVMLGLIGNTLLVLIGSEVTLVSNANLVLICLAFFIELNILLLVNMLVVTGSYRFVALYASTTLIGASLAVAVTGARHQTDGIPASERETPGRRTVSHVGSRGRSRVVR